MRRHPLSCAMLCAGLASFAPLANTAARFDTYGIGNLGTPAGGSGFSISNALNDAGQVTGQSYYYDNGVYQGVRAFLWSDGTLANLGSLGTNSTGIGYSYANALNESGQVAGYANYYVGGNVQGASAFLWSKGAMTKLASLGTDTSGYQSSAASAVNNSGQVAGTSEYYAGGVFKGSRAILWSNGTMSNLGTLGTDSSGNGSSTVAALNSAGQVAGQSEYHVSGTYQGMRAFLWSNGAMTNLGSLGTNASGWGSSTSRALNARGQVAGSSDYYVGGTSLGTRAFLWSDGTLTNLGSLGTDTSGHGYSAANALNNAGQVAGDSITFLNGASQGYRAFLWSNGTMTNLGSLGTNASGYGDSRARALNDTGQVAGASTYYVDGVSQGQHAFLWSNGTMHDLNALAPSGWTFNEATSINAWAQVAGNGSHKGTNEAFLITLHPDWQGGNGYWSDTSRWNYAGMGAFGFAPGTPHAVVINPAASATVYGPGSASVRSLTVFGQGSNLTTLDLNGGSIATQAGTALGNNGTLTGNGRLGGDLAVRSGGRVLVGNNESLQLAGNVGVASGGRIDAQARSQASLEIGGTLTNSAGGRVNLQNADVFVHGGTSNAGTVSIAGYSTVSGTLDNQAGGQVNVSGNGTQAVFWDSFRNNGSVTVTSTATATFFGQVDGAGSFSGGGAKEFAAGYLPGASPARVEMSGPITFSGGTVTMELGGTVPGSGHDKIVFGGPVSLTGAALSVIYWNGWMASAGQSYDLFDWNDGVSGHFASIALPTLASGLAWNTHALYTSGDLSVAAVPELDSYAMLLAGLGLMATMTFRRRRENGGRPS